MKKTILFIVCLLFVVFRPAWPQFSNQGAVRPLIAAQTVPASGHIDFQFQVPAGYHITDLKNNFFAIAIMKNNYAAVERILFPAGVPYGEESVFKGKFNVRVLLKNLNPIKTPLKLDFDVSFQICQEYPVELCYPPDQSLVQVGIGPDFSFSSSSTAGMTATATAASAAMGAAGRNKEPLLRRLEGLIRGQLSRTSLLLFLLVFAAGFLASLTPCVYPVIPIIMGYVGARSGGRKFKGFTLSIFFVLGLSLVYSLLGVVAAKTGSLIGISFQNPIVVTAIAAIFIIMGLSLAGLFTISAPSWISSRVSRSHKSDIAGALIVGGISAVIAAPCVGPVLIALLSWISQSGNIFLGFWLTMVFSLGMSVIFLVAGTFSGAISALPRGGQWMSTVKYFFAALLIAGGIYFLSNILSSWLTMAIWGIFLITLAVGLGLFRPQTENGLVFVLARTAVVLIFLSGAFLFYHGLAGHFFPAKVPTQAAVKKSLPWRSDLKQAKEKARTENKRLLIDVWAEWCAACLELDEKTFSRDDVREGLRDYVLVKLDLTRKSANTGQLQKELAIIGMPTIIFLDPSGKEIDRFSGFIDGSEFLDRLRSLKNNR
jgi:thiol:disulfide interchange protein